MQFVRNHAKLIKKINFLKLNASYVKKPEVIH